MQSRVVEEVSIPLYPALPLKHVGESPWDAVLKAQSPQGPSIANRTHWGAHPLSELGSPQEALPSEAQGTPPALPSSFPGTVLSSLPTFPVQTSDLSTVLCQGSCLPYPSVTSPPLCTILSLVL